MVQVYTDASLASGIAYTSCIILTDSNFIDYRTFEFVDIDSSLQAELLGIIEAVRYVKSLDLTEPVSIFTDSEASLMLFNNSNKNVRSKVLKQYGVELNTLSTLLTDSNITLQYIKGHSCNTNPNKLVDLTSHSLLSYKLNGAI